MNRKLYPGTQESSSPEEIVLARHGLLSERTEIPLGRGRAVEHLRMVWDQRPLLWRFVVAGFVISTLFAFVIPKRYTSTTRLMPPDDQSSSGLAMAAAALSGRSGGLGNIAGDVLGLKSTSDIFVGMLGSRTTQDALIEKFNLRKVYRDRNWEDARKELGDRTNVSVDRKSQIIEIEVTDNDPQRAAALGAGYVEELNNLVSKLSTSAARRERIFLEHRLQSVNKDLEAAESTFSQFASKNVAIDVPAQGKAMVEAAAVLQGQLIAAQSELEGLRQIYSDNNVRVRSANARVAELQSQLDRIGGKAEVPGDDQQKQGESMYPSIRKLPLLGVAYADLYRGTKIQEAIFETLTQQYELAKVQEAKEIPTVKVLDPPNIPEKKSYPPRSLIILLGTALAFSIGLTRIFSAALWSRVDPKDPGRVFAHEVFETVKARVTWPSSGGSSMESTNGHGRGVDSGVKARDSK
jgi:capsule polysaccharide export protein KpsE/RkpR